MVVVGHLRMPRNPHGGNLAHRNHTATGHGDETDLGFAGQAVLGKDDPYLTAASLSAQGAIGRGAAESKDIKQERQTGYVQRYSAADGWGMLRSKDIEGEIPFHADEIMPEFQTHQFAAADVVEFTVQANERGQRVGTLVKPRSGRSPYDVVGTRCRGYVRRFAERWGFLNAAIFDGDLFVHRDNLLPASDFPADAREPLLTTGQVVEFDVMLDDRGRVVAKMITTRIPSHPMDWIGQRITGYIRSFQDRWGFINSDRFLGDLFVHRDGLLPQCQGVTLTPGTVVEFDVRHDDHRQDSKNRLVARNVAVLQLAPADVAQQQNATPLQSGMVGTSC